MYLTITHFRHFIEGQQFKVFTDHIPLTFSLASHSDCYTPRQVRHLDYISQFTTDIQHISESSNPVADTLSCIELNATISQPQSTVIDFKQLTTSQQEGSQLKHLAQGSSSLLLKPTPAPTTDVMLLCDVLTGTARPYVPLKFRRTIFDSLHSLSHLGIRATQKLITACYVWPPMFKSGHVPVYSANALKCTDIQ